MFFFIILCLLEFLVIDMFVNFYIRIEREKRKGSGEELKYFMM